MNNNNKGTQKYGMMNYMNHHLMPTFCKIADLLVDLYIVLD